MDSIGGPLFALNWRGALCPCFEKSEDAGARKALVLLSKMEVRWLKSGRDKGIGGMVSGWFRSATSPNNKENASADAVESTLEWVDPSDKKNNPELHIKPLQKSSDNKGEISLRKQSSGYIKTVPLKQIDKVVIHHEESLIVLQTENENGTMKDLVTLQISSDGPSVEAVKEAFTQMVEWDGRRRAAIPEEDREIDEAQGIKRRAQKAAHFAKREIELQQQRRNREKRKARLVKDTGGLKYTALAMANRAAEDA